MSGETPRPLTNKTSIRILIVENETESADLIQAYLEREGYQLQVVSSAEEVPPALEQALPDLVVLDLLLLKDGKDADKPGGYEICRRLRADPRTADIPVLMFTVLDELEKIERGVEVDADDYLVKLSTPGEIRFRIESLLRVRHIKNRARRVIAYLRLLEVGHGERPASSPASAP